MGQFRHLLSAIGITIFFVISGCDESSSENDTTVIRSLPLPMLLR